MATLKFVLDIFVKSFKSPKLKEGDDKYLQFDVKFNSMKIDITKSRINVNDYVPTSSHEFSITADKLRKNIRDHGAAVKALLKNRAMGEGQIDFPEKFLDSIQEDMAELEHEDSCSILKKDDEVGTVTLKFRLIIKCENVDPEQRICRRNININETDIMFVMGDPQPCPQPCDTCPDAMHPEEGDERLELDLDRYKPIKQQEPEPPKESDDVPASLELQNLTKQYGYVIDSLLAHTNKLNSPMPDDQPIIDWSGKPAVSKKVPVERTIPVTLEDWEENGIKPIRFCPVCLTTMSWIPKMSPCPKCCTQPKLELKQMPEDQPTADQIVEQYLKLPKKAANPCKDRCKQEMEKRCSCTCKAGKMCLHCRMRVLNADLFEKKNVDRKECPVVKPTSKEDFCVVVEEQKSTCSTHLQRVFAELTELYTKKDAQDAAKQKLQASNSRSLSSSSPRREPGGQDASPAATAPKVNHEKCAKTNKKVPRNHGWYWTSTKQARNGWKPGAVCKYVGEIMKFFLQYPTDPSATNIVNMEEQGQKQKAQQDKPILNICKQNGAVCITLQFPEAEKPIMFRIVKSEEAEILSELKRKLKAKGYAKCTCHKPVMMCVCRESKEKDQLTEELGNVCQQLGMESCVDKLILSDTSESEMEYSMEVSPQTAPATRSRAPINRTINHSTQTSPNDLQVMPKYPIVPNPYYRPYDCATNYRYVKIKEHNGEEEEETEGGKTKKKSSNKSRDIPVRMPQRYYKAIEEAEQREKEAAEAQLAEKKKGVDLMKYLQSKGDVSKPWNPNDANTSQRPSKGPIVGPDGLTNAQRARRALMQAPVPPVDSIPRRAKGVDLCRLCSTFCNPYCYCYDPCYPCSPCTPYYCYC